MKIFFLIDSLGTGGAEKSMVEYAKFLIKTYDVRFICLDERKVSHEKEVLGNNIPIIYVESKNFIGQCLFLIDYFKRENPDILHSVLVRSNIRLRISRIFFNKVVAIESLVNTPYSLERKKDSNLPWYKFLIAKQLDILTARLFPSHYHVITNTVLNHYKPLFNINSNYSVIPRGRNENIYLKNSIASGDFLLINVGRQEFAKGQLDILKALNFLKNKFNISNLYLKILGYNGSQSKLLSDFVQNNNLDDQVEITGYVEDVEKQLSSANVFIFPSYYEGLGGALIEAFAAKLPCICSDIPVLQEVVGSKDGALFSPPGDYEALALNILKMYENENLRMNLAKYSYTRFQEAFKMNTIHHEMLNMYYDLIEKFKN
jgi:glycosyltransferase involved in cell wall biosynthesis